MLECVINISEGRNLDLVSQIATAASGLVLDVHSDADHHRSVITLAGGEVEEGARALTIEAVALLDIATHVGAHPRLGVVDVVPFVPLRRSAMADATGARDRFVRWAGDVLGVPAFSYGPERALPEVRRNAFGSVLPDSGLPVPHPRAGAVCVGARPVLVAFNVWLAPEVDEATARRVAATVRSGAIRALGLRLGDRSQVSMNLVDPLALGPMAAFDAVAGQVDVERAEVVGLVPAAVLDAVPQGRWAELDLDPSRTIEARLDGLKP